MTPTMRLLLLLSGGGAAVAPPGDPAWGAKGTDITLSNGNLNATVAFVGFEGVRTVQGRTSGKYYFELLVLATSSGGGLFIALMDDTTASGASMNALAIPNIIAVREDTAETVSGTFSRSAAVGLGGTLAISDVLQCAADITNKKVWFGKNNTWISGDPSAGTGEYGVWSSAYTIHAAAVLATQASVRLRATAASQTYAPPTGFAAWS
jgi:hypothetical protein